MDAAAEIHCRQPFCLWFAFLGINVPVNSPAYARYLFHLISRPNPRYATTVVLGNPK